MTTLVVATRNRHKVQEIRAILGEGFDVLDLNRFPDAPPVVEDAPTFEGNALKKAATLAAWLKGRIASSVLVLADDSGLEVDALNGAPGVNSARFAALDAGPAAAASGNTPDAANNARLLRLLAGVPVEQRTARFRCVLALAGEDPRVNAPVTFEGKCEGRIGFAPRGEGGFGYDPLFLPLGCEQSFAELGEEIKNGMSHRARALAKLKEFLRGGTPGHISVFPSAASPLHSPRASSTNHTQHCIMPNKETMTPRERVLKALNHEIPDRVPIDLGGNQTGIHKNAYRNLVKHLGIADEVRIMDAVQQLARPCEAVLQRLHVDTRYIAAGAPSSWKGGIVKAQRDGRWWDDLTDEFGVRWSMPEDAPYYMDITLHPLANATLADLQDYPWPKGDDPSRFAGLRERALTLKRETPYAVVSGISGVVYEICWYMRGLEQWFCDLMTNPAFCEAVLDQTLKFWLDWFRLFLDEVGDVVDVIMIGDDLAGQDGPLFNPAIYRRIVKPRHKRLVQYIRSRTHAKIWYHTCGACQEFIPEIIDNGAHILNPVQLSARNMDPVVLKQKFGGQIAFWGGGVDAQHILPRGTPEEVAANVRQNLAALMPGGGYIFNNCHNIQGEVPPENILAMFDTAYEYGFYPPTP